MAEGVLLDIDGVLTVSWEPLAGAVETVRWLTAEGIDFRLVTNTSSRTRRQIATLLARAGMEVDETQILTAVTSAARYLNDSHGGVGCFVVNEGDLSEDLEGVEIVGADAAGVVLLGGAGPSVGYEDLNAVFRLAMSGVPIVALHRSVRYQTADGPALDMGAFIVGLEAAADVEVTVVGKPAAAFFAAAVGDLGVDARRVIMVGDDIHADVLGAQDAGISGVLVRTGKFRPSDLEGNEEEPDHVLDGIGQLPDLLRSQASSRLASADDGLPEPLQGLDGVIE
jgi:HAD superfamily hydrolase (TIGR01458 family)